MDAGSTRRSSGFAVILVKEPLGFSYENRTVRFDIDLPPHAVAAVTLELAPVNGMPLRITPEQPGGDVHV